MVGTITSSIGIYLIHKTSSAFLAPTAMSWVAGPQPPFEVQCATGLEDGSFMVFGGDDKREVRQYKPNKDAPTSSLGWESWPRKLDVGRQSPACAVMGGNVIIAGGIKSNSVPIASMEVINIASRSIGPGVQMSSPRSHFALLVLNLKQPRLIALGYSTTNTEWIMDPVYGAWTQGPTMAANRYEAAAVAVPKGKCFSEPFPATTCPTVNGGDCIFPFSYGQFSH